MNVLRGVPGWKFAFRTLEESGVISHNRIARGHGVRPFPGVRQRSLRRRRLAPLQDQVVAGGSGHTPDVKAAAPLPHSQEGNVTADNACPVSNRAGLCVLCKHVRIIRSDRGSVFYLCRRSATDPTYPQYPRLPVLSCRGYEAQEKCDGARNDKPAGGAEPGK